MTNGDRGATNHIRDISLFAVFLLVGVFVGLGVRSLGGDAHAKADPAPMGTMDHSAHKAPVEPVSPAPPPPPPAPVYEGYVVDIGNEICPIMGNPVNGKAYLVWNGIRVGVCCPPCVGDLREAPEKLLDEAEVKWRAAVEVAAALNAATDEERPELLAGAKADWSILEPAPEEER